MSNPIITPPDFQPTLVGDTLLLRPVREDDWASLFAAASDPLIWEQHPAKDRYQEPVFRKFFDAAFSSRMALSIVDRATGHIIGSSRYHGHDAERSEVEIGWTFMARSHWGGATNRELKRLMLDHAFTIVDTVIFWVGETNTRSRRAMEKIGGNQRSGVHFRALAGPDLPHVIFEMRKKDLETALK